MTPESRPAPVVDAVAGARPVLGGLLLALALAALGGGVYFGYRAYEARPPADAAAPESADAPPPAAPNPDGLRRPELVLAALSLAMIAVALGAPGIQAVAAVDKPTLEGRRRDARRLIVLGGGLLGLVLMFAGFAFAVYHFGALVKWLDSATPPPDAYKPLVALLTFVVGAGVAFGSVQPARADERMDVNSRRLVFGANVVLTSLLLLAALVVLNLVIGLKVPNKIDTTASGVFSYELAPETKAFVAELQTPVKFYTTFPEDADPLFADTRRLLAALRDVNPARVAVEYLSPTVNAERITALRNKYPDAKGLGDYGVLLTVGEDEKQYAALGLNDLIQQARGGSGVQFIGEGRVLKELLFLAESKVRPAVYFTTGHGELEVAEAAPGQDAASRRPAAGLRAALAAAYIDVKPLAFDLTKPEVPADAAVVVVADPRRPLQPAEADALKAYLQGARAGGKKGKLVVLSSPAPAPGAAAGVADTGLGPVLADFGIALDDRYLLGQTAGQFGYYDQIVEPTQNAADAKVQFAVALAERPAVFRRCRMVRAGPAADPAVRAVPILVAGEGRVTWLEPDQPADPGKALGELAQNRDLARAKLAGRSVGRVVGAAAVEGDVGRVVVFGSGEAFQDPTRRGEDNPNVELFGQTVNYLRERPPVANVAAKSYGLYRVPQNADVTKMLVLPGLIGALGTVALGVGVFMLRRR